MAEKFTVEMKGQALKDLKEIAGLRKEPPHRLLARAFKEWVRLREDMEDIAVAEKEIAAYERDGEYYTHNEVLKELGLKTPPTRKRFTRSRRAAVSRVRA